MKCDTCRHVRRDAIYATVTGCAIPRVADRPCYDADVAAESRREDADARAAHADAMGDFDRESQGGLT